MNRKKVIFIGACIGVIILGIVLGIFLISLKNKNGVNDINQFENDIIKTDNDEDENEENYEVEKDYEIEEEYEEDDNDDVEVDNESRDNDEEVIKNETKPQDKTENKKEEDKKPSKEEPIANGKEKAEELAKKEWGASDDNVYYDIESSNGDNYLVTVRSKSTTSVLKEYRVNVRTSEVK